MKNKHARFESNYIPEPNSGCWLWLASVDKDGYGQFLYGKRAHRYSYEYYNGVIPAGVCVLHKCDNPSCVNPEHLFLGTNRDNINDMVNKGRSLSGIKNPAAKLTEDDVSNIRNDLRPIRIIAKDYNVGKSQIHNIKTNTSWTTKGAMK